MGVCFMHCLWLEQHRLILSIPYIRILGFVVVFCILRTFLKEYICHISLVHYLHTRLWELFFKERSSSRAAKAVSLHENQQTYTRLNSITVVEGAEVRRRTTLVIASNTEL